MDVIFDADVGMLYDFFLSINFNKKYGDMLDVYKANGVSCYQEVEESLRSIWNGLDTETPGLEALTSRINGKYSFLSSYCFTRLRRWKTADVFIEKMIQLLHNEMRYDILSYYDDEDHDREYYKEIASNASVLHQFINRLGLPDKTRLELIGIASGSDLYPGAIKRLFTAISERIAAAYRKYSEIIASGSEKMQKMIDSSDEFVLLQTDNFKEMHRKVNFKTAFVAMSFLNPITVMYGKDEEDINVLLGVENKYLGTHTKESIDHQTLLFKALSDDSRIRIIELLREKEMYIGEIAKALDIPLTTLAYHIRTLHMADILLIREEGKKTYCRFQPHKLAAVAELLNKMSGMEDMMQSY